MFVLYVSEIFLEWVCWVLDILRISQDSSGNFRVYSTFTNKINNYPQHSNANWTPLAVRGPQLAPLKTCRVANTIHRNVSKRVANSSNSVSENLVLWHLFVLFCTNWMLVFIRDGQLAPPSKRQLGNQLAPLRGCWYRQVPWDGTLNHQPHTHLISRGYLLGPNLFWKGRKQRVLNSYSNVPGI